MGRLVKLENGCFVAFGWAWCASCGGLEWVNKNQLTPAIDKAAKIWARKPLKKFSIEDSRFSEENQAWQDTLEGNHMFLVSDLRARRFDLIWLEDVGLKAIMKPLTLIHVASGACFLKASRKDSVVDVRAWACQWIESTHTNVLTIFLGVLTVMSRFLINLNVQVCMEMEFTFWKVI